MTTTTDPKCPSCGSAEGIYARADLRWHPVTQSWEASQVADTLECTECDHEWSIAESPEWAGTLD